MKTVMCEKLGPAGNLKMKLRGGMEGSVWMISGLVRRGRPPTIRPKWDCIGICISMVVGFCCLLMSMVMFFS